MNENDNENVAEPVQPAQPVEPVEPIGPAQKTSWRDRTFRWRSLTAVAVAGLVLGAAGGAVTTALVDHDGDHGRFERGPHRMEMHMPPGGPPMLPPQGQQDQSDPEDEQSS